MTKLGISAFCAASGSMASTDNAPELPAEVLRQHLVPMLVALAPHALRSYRRASRSACGDAALWVSGIRRLPGTHPLPPDLGRRFPKLIRLVSGCRAAACLQPLYCKTRLGPPMP